ncbi:hypothetical protein E2C01_087338 [Portunus trituberculatus]|uniref:Uncharacterized protein n=1 Tax=Portunus trituberculatus TaxID=210409 RepID=A0A5B7JBL6_PORTR|nr:hypothetical protein [Portunus trituberculatus]
MANKKDHSSNNNITTTTTSKNITKTTDTMPTNNNKTSSIVFPFHSNDTITVAIMSRDSPSDQANYTTAQV